MHSLWWETCKIQERQTLEKDLETQVLVIGGGMAGILTAYQLQKSGKKVSRSRGKPHRQRSDREHDCQDYLPAWSLLSWLSEKNRSGKSQALCQGQPGCYPGI